MEMSLVVPTSVLRKSGWCSIKSQEDEDENAQEEGGHNGLEDISNMAFSVEGFRTQETN